MRTLQQTLLLGCVLAAASAGLAQTAVTTTPVKKPLVAVKVEPVLSHIPAGSAGFLVLNNVEKSVGNLEKFIDGIGMGEMIKQNMPDGLLRAALASLNVGDGFNPGGGLAVVMLDPKKFDVDLIGLITGSTPQTTKPAKEPKLPLVIFVPGTGVESVFAAFGPVKAGKSWKINSPAGPVFARQHVGYILVSPTDKAIDAVVASRVPVAKTLTPAQLVAIAASDITVYLNMDVVGPLGAKGLDMFAAELKNMPGRAMAMDIGKVFGFYKSLLTQAKSAVITVRLSKSAAIIDKHVTFKPDSLIGKAIALAKFAKGAPLGRLPNLSYVFAANTHYAGAEANKQLMALMAPLMGEMFKGDKEARAKYDKLNTDLTDQAQSVQVVIGGAPKDGGVFGLAYVITCQDSAKLKAMTAGWVDMATTIWTSMLPKGEIKDELSKVKITYAKAAETVAGLSVDTIEIDHPEIAELNEDNRDKLKGILGEDKIRVRIAAVNKTTLVATFGGGKAFLAETIKAAKGGGTIPADAGVKTAMTALPRNSQMVMLLSIGNLWKLVENTLTVLNIPTPPINITATDPIAIGVKVSGTSLHAAVYVPSSVVKDVVQTVLGLVSRPGLVGPPPGETNPPPTEGGEDF